MDRKNCPYCGEEIAATAKKCRFCGEWLEIEEAVLMPENADAAQIQEYASPAADIAVNGYTEGPLPATINVNGVAQQQYPQQPYTGQPAQPGAMQQPVINIQVAQSQETNVSQEQTVIVEKRGNSSSGWLWFEIFGVAGGVWGLTGLITLIALGVALQIPIIGTLICVVLGCGLGLLAGVIAAALSAPTWACWLIGLVATGVMIGINIEDKNSDDFYD